MRLFAGDRIYKILDKLGTVDEDGNEEPIEAGMLSKQIEKAQKKVEEQNFLIRKRVLEYDDVMNEQRRVVYEYRDEVLEGRDMGPVARENVADVVRRVVDEYTVSEFIEDWDLDGLFTALADIFPVDFGPDELDRVNEREELVELLVDDAQRLYGAREEELGEELMRALERYLLLQIIDNKWREHLYDMDYLREGIHLRGFAQIDPLVAYKNEAFELFTDLMNSIWADFARMIYHVEVEVEGTEAPAIPQAGGPVARARSSTPAASAPSSPARCRPRRRRRLRRRGRGDRGHRRQRRGRSGGRHPDRPAAPRRRARHHRAQRPVLVRLSGKKYKKCHGA